MAKCHKVCHRFGTIKEMENPIDEKENETKVQNKFVNLNGMKNE